MTHSVYKSACPCNGSYEIQSKQSLHIHDENLSLFFNEQWITLEWNHTPKRDLLSRHHLQSRVLHHCWIFKEVATQNISIGFRETTTGFMSEFYFRGVVTHLVLVLPSSDPRLQRSYFFMHNQIQVAL